MELVSFQKCRYYGLHASASYKKYKDTLPKDIKSNEKTVRTIFQIIRAMLGINPLECDKCAHTEFDISPIKADVAWIKRWIYPLHNKDPIGTHRTYHSNYHWPTNQNQQGMPKNKRLATKSPKSPKTAPPT